MLSRYLSRLLDPEASGRITPDKLQAFYKPADKDETGFITADA